MLTEEEKAKIKKETFKLYQDCDNVLEEDAFKIAIDETSKLCASKHEQEINKLKDELVNAYIKLEDSEYYSKAKDKEIEKLNEKVYDCFSNSTAEFEKKDKEIAELKKKYDGLNTNFELVHFANIQWETTLKQALHSQAEEIRKFIKDNFSELQTDITNNNNDTCWASDYETINERLDWIEEIFKQKFLSGEMK